MYNVCRTYTHMFVLLFDYDDDDGVRITAGWHDDIGNCIHVGIIECVLLFLKFLFIVVPRWIRRMSKQLLFVFWKYLIINWNKSIFLLFIFWQSYTFHLSWGYKTMNRLYWRKKTIAIINEDLIFVYTLRSSYGLFLYLNLFFYSYNSN